MKLRRWYSQRSPAFIRQRVGALVSRYGITPARAEARVQATVTLLALYGCAPTFPTPGRVVDAHPAFIRRLQQQGVEIAVHSYDHLDLRGYSPAEGSRQLLRAADAFARLGIEAHGFRCPYLSWSPALLDALPAHTFGYSSNGAIRWDVETVAQAAPDGPVLRTLEKFYRPLPASEVPCVPYMRGDLVEIPVCVPDDLQLLDGLRLGSEAVAKAWIELLHATYERGELFNLIFHPELAEDCEGPFHALLQRATGLQPQVWIAKLCEIEAWWREKGRFGAQIMREGDGWLVTFQCSPRATILARGFAPGTLKIEGSAEPWAGPYTRLYSSAMHVLDERLPFLGLPADAPESTVMMLSEQGYLLCVGDLGRHCAVHLDRATMAGLTSQVALIEYIERQPGHLVRYGRWPDGNRSALSVTGDLDALSLVDYSARLFVR